MIWNAMVVMSVFDVLFIAATAVVIYFVIFHSKAIAFVGAMLELCILVAGVLVWASVYLVDLVIMMGGPLFLSQEEVMGMMGFMHLNVRWVTDAIAAILMMTGFFGLIRQFSRKIETIRSTRDALKSELNVQSTLKDELQSQALTERADNRSKSEFLLGLCEELRTPLNGIVGLAGLLDNTGLNDDQRKLLTTLDQSAKAILARLNDVLDLSKLESGQVQLRPTAYRPSEIIQNVEALFGPLAVTKGVSLETHTSEAAQRQVIGDALLVKQIVCNLVSNAVKFTPAGSIRISVDIHEDDTGRFWSVYSVADTGVGMSSEKVDAFSRPLPPADGGVGEFGLGLSISWHLAALMGGGMFRWKALLPRAPCLPCRSQLKPKHRLITLMVI